MCRMFAGRTAQGERLTAAAELAPLCGRAATVVGIAIGATPQHSSTYAAVTERWGPIDNVFAARLRADGSYYLDASPVATVCQTAAEEQPAPEFSDSDSAASSASAEPAPNNASQGGVWQPIEAPEVYFVADWPMRDARWRNLEDTMVWPALQQTLQVLGKGALCAWQQHIVQNQHTEYAAFSCELAVRGASIAEALCTMRSSSATPLLPVV